MTVATELLYPAARLCEVSLDSSELSDALAALNAMLDGWAADPAGVFSRTLETFTLTSGTASYGFASGSDLDGARPTKIKAASIRQNSIDYPVDCRVTPIQFETIAQKSTTGRPYLLSYDRAYPTGNVLLYPTPDAAYSLRVLSHKAIDSYSATDATVTQPPEYVRAIKFNLAVELAAEFGKQVLPQVFGIADQSYNALARINRKDLGKRLNTDPFTSPANRHYDITGDQFF